MKPWERNWGNNTTKPWERNWGGNQEKEVPDEKPQFSEETLAQIKANNEAYEKRQEENRPWFDKGLIRPVARLGVAAMQGIANSGLNPAYYLANAFGMDTKPFEPENLLERGVERASEYAYGAAPIAKGIQGLSAAKVGGEKLLGKVLQQLGEGGAKAAVRDAVGAGLLTGAIKPENPYMAMATDAIGAGLTGRWATPPKTKMVSGGLSKAVGSNKATKTINSGIRAKENVAQEVYDAVPRAKSELQDEARQALEQATGRKLDVDTAITNSKQSYDDFISQNKDRIVLDVSELNGKLPSRVGRGKDVTPDDIAAAKQKLIDSFSSGNYENITFGSLPEKVRAEINQIRVNSGQQPLDANVIIPGNVVKKWSTNRIAEGYSPERIAQIADEVFHSENVNVSKGKHSHIQKLTKEREGHNNDFVGFISRNDKTGDTVAKTVYQKPRKGLADRQSTSLQENPVGRKRISDLQASSVENNIAQNVENVNSKMPSIEELSQGLSKDQQEVLNSVIQEGSDKVTNPEGSLRAVHRALERLNKRIDNVIYENPLRPRTIEDPDVKELLEVKNRLNKALEFGGIKPYDAHIAKAKTLREFWEKGYNFKPSEIKLEKMDFKTRRNKQAFIQGVMQKVVDNVTADTNLAKNIKKDETIFRKLLTKNQYDKLMRKANQIDRRFENLKSIENTSKRKLTIDADRSESKLKELMRNIFTPVVTAADKVADVVSRGSRSRAAMDYLNPVSTIKQNRGGAEAVGRQSIIDLLEYFDNEGKALRNKF